MDKKIQSLSIEARLTYIGLWNFAEDHGCFFADPRLVKSAVYPIDDNMTIERVTRVLDELSESGRIVLYEFGDGEVYGQIPKWLEHQRIDKPSKTTIRPLGEGSTIVRGVLAVGREGKGRDVGIGIVNSIPRVSVEKTLVSNAKIHPVNDRVNTLLNSAIESHPEKVKLSRIRDGISTWVAYKKEKGQPYKKIALRILLDDLAERPHDEVEAAIKHSIANNYSGIVSPTHRNGTAKDPSDEEWERTKKHAADYSNEDWRKLMSEPEPTEDAQ